MWEEREARPASTTGAGPLGELGSCLLVRRAGGEGCAAAEATPRQGLLRLCGFSWAKKRDFVLSLVVWRGSA